MYIILTYDVGVRRNPKMLKVCRRYLTHVQKSVFEGFITNRKMEKLKREIENIILPDNDQVAIYQFDSVRYMRRETIGYLITKENIL